jgi:hypothetical protein
MLGSRQFQEWGNTLGDGSLAASLGGYVGNPARVIWTPGTIAAGSSSSVQTTTVTGAIVGDEVKIIPDPATTPLPQGVIATGYVSSANTVSWQVLNTTTAAITINSGGSVNTYVSVDRPPLNPLTPAFLNGVVKTDSLLTVATLPTCNASAEGQIKSVSDATAPTYNAALTGGGAVHVPVYCNGSAWVSH